MALVLYTLTLEKLHDVALLKLIGAPNRVLLGMVIQESLLLGGASYAMAYLGRHGRLSSFSTPRDRHPPTTCATWRARCSWYRCFPPAWHCGVRCTSTRAGALEG